MKLLLKQDEDSSAEHPRRRLHFPHLSNKKIIYGAIAIGVFVLIVWAFRPAPIPVETAQVTSAPLQVTVNAEGKTRVSDRFVVSAPVNGRLTRIRLDEGDRVKK